MFRLYIITSKTTGAILAVSHGRSIDCQHMSEEMYQDSFCEVQDVNKKEAKRLLEVKWQFKKAV